MNRQVFKVIGMTCTGCEDRIEKKLKRINGVYAAKPDFTTGLLTLVFDEKQVTLETISDELDKIGYQMNGTVSNQSDRTKNIQTRNVQKKIFLFGGIALFIVAIYMLISKTVGFNYVPQVSQSMSYTMLFIVGLLTSLHCISMCGGINLTQTLAKQNKQSAGPLNKLSPSFLYNLGRVVSYTVIGGLLGSVGFFLGKASISLNMSYTIKAVIFVIAGLFMIMMGLNMFNAFSWLKKFSPHLPRFFVRKINQEKRNKTPFVVGLLNGLMPCGPLQMVQLYALGTSSVIEGAFSMFLFSLGTVPLMFGLGATSSFLSARFTRNMMKISALLVIILGAIMINRGLSVSGHSVETYLASKTEIVDEVGVVAVVQGDLQEIKTDLEPDKYPKMILQPNVPFRWTINATKDTLNGCNGEIVIPQYQISKKLQLGENVIEFTPTDEGVFGYSCWMGMINSQIIVSKDKKEIPTSEEQSTTSMTNCACCQEEN